MKNISLLPLLSIMLVLRLFGSEESWKFENGDRRDDSSRLPDVKLFITTKREIEDFYGLAEVYGEKKFNQHQHSLYFARDFYIYPFKYVIQNKGNGDPILSKLYVEFGFNKRGVLVEMQISSHEKLLSSGLK